MLRLFLPGDGICDRERRRSDHSQIPPGMVGGMAYEGASHNLLRGWPSRPCTGVRLAARRRYVWRYAGDCHLRTPCMPVKQVSISSHRHVRSVHPADKGLVITTSLQVARQVRLPGGYELLPFPEIVRTSAEGLVLDRQRFGSWLRGMRPTTAKGAPTRLGRPSPLALIRRIYHSRREQGLNLDNDSAEARAILTEWPNYAPDEEPPGPSTVRGHVARLKNSEASAR